MQTRSTKVLQYFLVALVLCESVQGTNFQKCFNGFVNSNSTSGGVDYYGRPVNNMSLAVGLTYQTCKGRCGTAPVSFSWPDFSQQFTTWLLPWLALISQLPYGANDREGNFEAMVLSVGSPMVAAYSLSLIVTSNRWMVKQLEQKGPGTASIHVARVFGCLRDVWFRLPKSVPSLDDKSWEELAHDLESDTTKNWTIPAILSMIYVGVSYILTWVDTLQSDVSTQLYANGQASGSIWLALFPIILCHLQLPPVPNSFKVKEILKKNGNTGEWALKDGGDHAGHRDHLCSTPIFFYARIYSWQKELRRVIEPKPMKLNIRSVSTYDFLSIHLRSMLLALFLQWGTTCAAIMSIYLTPAKGFGCRSLAFLIYGSLATLIWIFLFLSGLLTSNTNCPKIFAIIATILRLLAKILAMVNTVGLIVTSLFQFSNLFNNCYCNCSVLGLGDRGYIITQLTPDNKRNVKFYWAGGMIMTSFTAVLFAFAIRVLDRSLNDSELTLYEGRDGNGRSVGGQEGASDLNEGRDGNGQSIGGQEGASGLKEGMDSLLEDKRAPPV